jgi:GNAT superfamily N-acetyltransferase
VPDWASLRDYLQVDGTELGLTPGDRFCSMTWRKLGDPQPFAEATLVDRGDVIEWTRFYVEPPHRPSGLFRAAVALLEHWVVPQGYTTTVIARNANDAHLWRSVAWDDEPDDGPMMRQSVDRSREWLESHGDRG